MLGSISHDDSAVAGFIHDYWFSLGFHQCQFAQSENVQNVSDIPNKIHLVFDGVIYNLSSLISKLEQKNSIKKSSAEIILAMYKKYGPSLADFLEGDYTIIIMDCRCNSCYLFRDDFGIKPLFYSMTKKDNIFLFASDVRAFFNYPEFKTELDEVALAEKKVLNFWANDRTCFHEIHQLIPGHIINLHFSPIFKSSSLKFERSRNKLDNKPSIMFKNNQAIDVVRRCTNLLKSAIKKRLENLDAAPVIMALSGGVDSSVMAFFANEISDEIRAVTIYDNPKCPDMKYSAKFVSLFGIHHHSRQLEKTLIIKEFPQIIISCASNGLNYFSYLLSKTIKDVEPNARVVLCAEGADELFLGYPLYAHPTIYFSEVFKELESIPQHIINESRLLQRASKWMNMDDEKRWLDFISLFQQDQLVISHSLPLNNGGRAFGLEYRFPYLDKELWEYVQVIPKEFMIFENETKIFLKLVLAEELSEMPSIVQAILKRPKSAAFMSMLESRELFRNILKENEITNKLYASKLGTYTKNIEDFFWLASIIVVFMIHRGNVEGMHFKDLINEVRQLAF